MLPKAYFFFAAFFVAFFLAAFLAGFLAFFAAFFLVAIMDLHVGLIRGASIYMVDRIASKGYARELMMRHHESVTSLDERRGSITRRRFAVIHDERILVEAHRAKRLFFRMPRIGQSLLAGERVDELPVRCSDRRDGETVATP